MYLYIYAYIYLCCITPFTFSLSIAADLGIIKLSPVLTKGKHILQNVSSEYLLSNFVFIPYTKRLFIESQPLLRCDFPYFPSSL